MRKYEIYLPLKYNDGREIEVDKIKQIREELIAVFGALTVSSQSVPYQGSWKYGSVNFIDDVIKISQTRRAADFSGPSLPATKPRRAVTNFIGGDSQTVRSLESD
jgi:hypothetical protein